MKLFQGNRGKGLPWEGIIVNMCYRIGRNTHHYSWSEEVGVGDGWSTGMLSLAPLCSSLAKVLYHRPL